MKEKTILLSKKYNPFLVFLDISFEKDFEKKSQYLIRGKCNLNDFTEGKLSQSVCPKTLKEWGEYVLK